MTSATATQPRPAGAFARFSRAVLHRAPFSVFVTSTILGLLLIGAIGADIIRPLDTSEVDLSRSLQEPSLAYPMGTDMVGRDLFAYALHGVRLSFLVSILAAIVAMIIGAAIGLISGTFGGRVDAVIMRGIDVFQSQNHFLFAILVVVLFRPSLGGAGAIALSVAITHWVVIARIVRGELLSLRERTFVKAAVNGGATRMRLARRHYLPHLIPQGMLGFVLLLPHAIFHEAGLSFLGLGVPPDQASLGNLLADSRRSLLLGAWWASFFPGLIIFLAAVSVGALGEYLRDRNNPRWRAELEL